MGLVFKGSIFLDIFIQERFDKLIYCIKTIIKCVILQPVKFKLVSRFRTGSKKIFYRVSELILAT